MLLNAVRTLRALFLYGMLCVYLAGPVDAQPASSGVRTLPFEYINHIFIQASLNETQPATLLYDPVRNIILDRHFVARWGLPTYGGEEVGYGGPVRIGGAGAEEHVARFARDVQMVVGEETFSYPLVTIVPLDSVMATALGRHVDGLFGTNVLDAYILEFDFDRERFVLHDPAVFTAPPGSTELPITRMEASRKPTIAATLTLNDGTTLSGHFLLDFGMGGTLRLTTRFVNEHNLAERLTPSVTSNAERGLGGTLQSLVARLPAMTLKGLVVENLTTSLAREESGADADRAWDGLIGLGLLDRFHVYLNLRGNRIWLKPNHRFAEPFIYVPTGLRFAVPDPAFGGLRIVDVQDGSTGQQAGLQAGDTIVGVDGVSTKDWNRRDWESAVHRKEGATFTLTIRRGASEIEVVLPLHDPLDPQ